MPKFELRVVLKVPVWAYAEVEAASLEEALKMLEKNPSRFIDDIDMEIKDTVPGELEPEFVFTEVKNSESKWIAAY